ncbi:phage/plasmid replication domain-containing protein [[Scytonema hofmanni] UTEX B 1581]|uniref:phage/plasmid replication domain-containing protein n=1 Tax=[Scytonema hofmanni] UTEX B 1581 TaxID=379535 RepID=UPI0004970033|nr:phage/plasmid replication protein [[Scytonema hofmanni] UTEX B 1581]
MIDTLKLGIPLTQSQHNKLEKLLEKDENWQWVKFQPSSGELKLVRCRGLAFMDQHSFHRDIRWDVSPTYIPEETFLTLELSVPKFWYGHNIHLLYDFAEALAQLKKILDKQLHCRFSDAMTWKVLRVDCCYAWRCPSQKIAQQILDSLKRLHFPRKKPIIYPESILFAGATYSVKFYLKYPEFLQHDRKILLKDKASLEWINYLEELSKGVLRYEATLRRQYLKTKNINTVFDLTNASIKLEWSQEFIELNDHITEDNPEALSACMMIIIGYTNRQKYNLSIEEIHQRILDNNPHPLNDGDVYYAPPQTLIIEPGDELVHKGGGFTIRKVDNPTSILQYFLKRFLGENRGMQEADEVKLKLYQKYKRDKAHRLYATWLAVQRDGSQGLKEDIGDRSFYRIKADLKAAGCSFVEPPKVTTLDDKFIKSFTLDVPSNYATNQVDDFRDSSNVINILPHLIEQSVRQQRKEK